MLNGKLIPKCSFNGSPKIIARITPKRISPENNCFLGSLEISSAATSCSTSPASVISCLGNKCLPMSIMNTIVAIVKGMPIQANSKKPNGSIPNLVNVPLTMILGGVPTIVMIPPIPAANAKGINWRDAGILATAQIPTTTGSNAAVVPVLDKNADMVAVTSIIASIKPFSLVPA